MVLDALVLVTWWQTAIRAGDLQRRAGVDQVQALVWACAGGAKTALQSAVKKMAAKSGKEKMRLMACMA